MQKNIKVPQLSLEYDNYTILITISNGSINYYIPNHWTGKMLYKFKSTYSKEINKFKNFNKYIHLNKTKRNLFLKEMENLIKSSPTFEETLANTVSPFIAKYIPQY